MRKIFLYFSLLLFMQTAFAADSLFVRKPQIPILIDRTDNILVEMRVQAHKGDVLNKLSLQFKEGIDLNDIKALRFFYSGTEATSRQGKHYRPVSYISSHAEGKTKAANPAYSIKQSEVTDITNVVTFTSNQPMVEGVNYYWISIEMKPEAYPYIDHFLQVHTAVVADIVHAQKRPVVGRYQPRNTVGRSPVVTGVADTDSHAADI